MMLYRPVPFLLVPGLLAFLFGLALFAGVYLQGGSRMHSLILGGLLAIIGYQMLLAGPYFEAFGASYGISHSGRIKKLISYHSLEKELFLGMVLLSAGGHSRPESDAELGSIWLRSTGCSLQRHDGHDIYHSGNPDHLLRNVHKPAPAR
jgi:hypothetical protein